MQVGQQRVSHVIASTPQRLSNEGWIFIQNWGNGHFIAWGRSLAESAISLAYRIFVLCAIIYGLRWFFSGDM